MFPLSWIAAVVTLFLLLRPALSQIPPKYATHFLLNTTLTISYGNHTLSDGEILPHALTTTKPAATLLPPPHGTVALVLVDAESNTAHWVQRAMRPVQGRHNAVLMPHAPAEMDYRPPRKQEIGTRRYVFLVFADGHRRRGNEEWWRSENPVAGAYFKVASKSARSRKAHGLLSGCGRRRRCWLRAVDEKSWTNSSEEINCGHEPSEGDTMDIRIVEPEASSTAVVAVAAGVWSVIIAVATATLLAL
jgi:hypothetical protein